MQSIRTMYKKVRTAAYLREVERVMKKSVLCQANFAPSFAMMRLEPMLQPAFEPMCIPCKV